MHIRIEGSDLPGRPGRAQADGLLVARLGLTGSDGGPLCARLRPPDITWLLE